jgi:PPK2 family polyphosphate:nucleotide phosphotransferase
VTDSLVVRPGSSVDLVKRDPSSTPGAPGDRSKTEAVFSEQHERLFGLQDRFTAEGKRGLLVVLQGIDTSGKDGTIRHVFGGLSPSATRVASFGVPTPIEAAHDFLWRIHLQVPKAGEVVIFNRSHYEDVLVARVHKLVPPRAWKARYAHINAFEALLHACGTTVVKFMLHISQGEQQERFSDRLSDPTKLWKFKEADRVESRHWDEYQKAFTDMLEKTSTEQAPWHVVPADHKWYRNWAVTEALVDVLEKLDPRYPVASG